MSIKAQNQVFRYTGGTTFSLTADADESFRVRRIFVNPNAAETKLTFLVDRVSIQTWRVYGFGGNHLSYPFDRDGRNLRDVLMDLGIDFTIPIATGQSLTCTLANSGTVITVVYDIYTADEVKPNEINGTDADIFTYLNYIENTAAIASGASGLLDKSAIGVEFPAFPAGELVPPRSEMTLFGIAGTPVSRSVSSANVGNTGYIKLIRERETLFDINKNGLDFFGISYGTGTDYSYDLLNSVIGDGTPANPEPPLILPKPLVFIGGEELNVYATDNTSSSTGLGALKVELAFILQCRRSS